MATALVLVFPLCMVWAMWTDIAGYRISNWTVCTLALGFLPFAFAVGMPWGEIGIHFATGFLALLAVYALFMLGTFGAGDGKLIAATLLWLGPGLALPYFAVFAVVGGVMALMIGLFRAFPLAPVLARSEWAVALHTRAWPVPYGAALCPGGLAAFALSPHAGLLGLSISVA